MMPIRYCGKSQKIKKFHFYTEIYNKNFEFGGKKEEIESQINYTVSQILLFFGKCFKKKLLNIFPNLFFYLKVQSFLLIMKNNFIQIAASAGHAVAYTIGSIFKHIIDCVQLYFTNGLTNIVL